MYEPWVKVILFQSPLARLYPFLERRKRGSTSLLFSTPDLLNILFLADIQKV
jgi:hypothetical protein